MFTKNLVALRKRKMLTQAQLADKLGIAQSTLASYERGLREPNFEMLRIIADYFGVTTAELISDVPGLFADTSFAKSTYQPDPSTLFSGTGGIIKQPTPKDELSPDEAMLLDLFRRIPEADRPLVLQMIRAALATRK